MNNFLKYLKVQSLRTIKKYPVILIFTILLTASIVIFAITMFSSNNASEEKQKIKVGLVGDISDTYMGIGITAIQNFDFSQHYVEFITMDKDTAVEKLKNKDLLGYIEVPEGFVDSVLHGENKHLTYMAGNSPSTIGPIMMNEVIQLVSDLVLESQNGVYGYMRLAQERDIPLQDIYGITDRIALDYVDVILGRDKLYTVEEYGVGEELSFENYYIVAFVVLILLLWGMTSVSLLTKTDMSLPRTLKSLGHNSVGLILGEYVPFFVMICVNMMLLLIGASVLASVSGVEHEFLLAISSWSDCLKILLLIIPAIALITSMQFFIYELSSNIISAVLMQLLVVVSMSYVSGFFFPLYSLPQSIQNIAQILPTYKAFSCISNAIFYNPDMTNVMTVWMYFAIFIILSVITRRHKMRSNRYD